MCMVPALQTCRRKYNQHFLPGSRCYFIFSYQWHLEVRQLRPKTWFIQALPNSKVQALSPRLHYLPWLARQDTHQKRKYTQTLKENLQINSRNSTDYHMSKEAEVPGARLAFLWADSKAHQWYSLEECQSENNCARTKRNDIVSD